MKTSFIIIFIFFTGIFCLASCQKNRDVKEKVKLPKNSPSKVTIDNSIDNKNKEYLSLKTKIVSQFNNKIPTMWREKVAGVKTALDTKENVIALTFDACGSEDDGYDAQLIEYLVKERIPATLFISGKWIDAHHIEFESLFKNPLFEIENHGLQHKPCSVSGKSAYGIKGTESCEDVIDEIELNARKIASVTGHTPKYYRSGTAYYDETAVSIANALGYDVVNYTVLGDAGATFSKEQIKKALLGAKPSSIIILHMNHPEKEVAEGVIAALPELKSRGFKFVKLSEYKLR